eukprot:856216-Amphidinium_carterae.1
MPKRSYGRSVWGNLQNQLSSAQKKRPIMNQRLSSSQRVPAEKKVVVESTPSFHPKSKTSQCDMLLTTLFYSVRHEIKTIKPLSVFSTLARCLLDASQPQQARNT